MENVLISGGTGMIGRKLSQKLSDSGFEVNILSRSPKKSARFKEFFWDPEKKIIDPAAIDKADHIIHLAGKNILRGRWTEKNKRKIIDSRVKTGELLFEKVVERKRNIQTFISASAIGYYGAITTEKILEETDGPGTDFVAQTSILWEEMADKFNSVGARVVKIRTSPVLAKEGGALDQLKIPVRLGFGSAIGSGKQYFPWIHIDDICGIYIKALEDKNMCGVYNASAPDHTTNDTFMRTLAKVLKKPYLLPNVPAFLLKLILGEKGKAALEGSRISSEKIMKAGYNFEFPELEGALRNIFELS